VGEHVVNDARLSYGVPACPNARDSVDRILLAWERERPDLDFTPVGVVTRLARVRAHLDSAVGSVFARYGLTAADFGVIITLRRAGDPFSMPQARLMDALGLTSGTVSVRLDRLAKSGVVTREADPANARVSVVTLTEKGVRLFDEVAPIHLANEDRLLTALSGQERQTLADLLRRLLADFETTPTYAAAILGLTLEPAHLARARRQAVGLSDQPGLLVLDVGAHSPAEQAGVQRGDLIATLDGTAVHSSVALALHLHDTRPASRIELGIRRGDEDVRLRIRVPAGDPGAVE
jgi:DNA-binding MarR family transcriptional regulator